MKLLRPAQPGPARNGVSLIECVLYMFLLSAIGLLGFQILSRVLRIDVAGSHLEEAQRQRTRLARTWREDVHRAGQIIRPAMDSESDEVELFVDGAQVLYAGSDERSITRKVVRDESPVAFERWNVDGVVRFRRSQGGRLIALELDAPRGVTPSAPDLPAGSARPDPLQTTVIDASVGTARPRPPATDPEPAREGT